MSFPCGCPESPQWLEYYGHNKIEGGGGDKTEVQGERERERGSTGGGVKGGGWRGREKERGKSEF